MFLILSLLITHSYFASQLHKYYNSQCTRFHFSEDVEFALEMRSGPKRSIDLETGKVLCYVTGL